MDFLTLFDKMHPGFFAKEYIRDLDPEEVFEEQLLPLSEFDADALKIAVPDGITFGFYRGELPALHEAVRQVEEDWVQYFQAGDRVFCAFFDGMPISFCLLDGMGEYELDGRHIRIAGPGCVGTLPAFRRKGIGLKMVQLATDVLKNEGYDYSYIHYTAVGPWYARLGYRTILCWNANGIIE